MDTVEGKKRTRGRRDVGCIPAGTATLLSKDQIRAALGIGERTFDGMLAAGDYPRADFRLGALPRWRVETHNAWVEGRCKEP